MSQDMIHATMLDVLHAEIVHHHRIKHRAFCHLICKQPGEDNQPECPSVKTQPLKHLSKNKGTQKSERLQTPHLLINDMTKVLNILTVLLKLKYKIERARYSKSVQLDMTTILSKQM